ncbi:efflux RND transporter periplasmic adaptor subunit [Patescibacteria group bacterium]|nr:efflux RND transporter periplasmic adaptor subunit [Patescibacteria group bacterium]MBU1954237.1 efflux RND transporter periplasmic adaptor subunit [Patescibacteria group bacterium]
MLKFLKKPSVIVGLIVVILIVAGMIAFGKKAAPLYQFSAAEIGNVIQEVYVTGRVKSANNVNLAFEKSGKVSTVYKGVGDIVNAGQALVTVESADIAAQLNQALAEVDNSKALLAAAKANMESASAQLKQAEVNTEIEQINLDELKKGTRSEEVKIAQTKADNAEKAVTDAENNLETITLKNATDLDDAYADAITDAQNAVNIGKNSLLTLTNIQYNYFASNDQNGSRVTAAKEIAVKYMLGVSGSGYYITDVISTYSGGAYGTVQNATSNPTHENIDQGLSETIIALQKVKEAFETVPVLSTLPAATKTELSTEIDTINTELISVSGKQNAIATQKASNAASLSTAEISLTTAQNNLLSAEDELDLKKAGATKEQIASQQAQVNKALAAEASEKAKIKQTQAAITSNEAMVKKAEANANNYRAQLAKLSIIAPISGIITIQDAKVGEIVPAGTTIVSLISENMFEIEANVPEADIAKVSIGNTASLTLDAYGKDVLFEATVTAIDPAETMIEGVATYKVTFQFTEEDDRVKSGMTAKITIASNKRENVLSIPQRGIVRRNGTIFVRTLDNKNNIKEVTVEVGLRGSDGNIEILNGLNEGDKVITFSDYAAD